jgi:hypothetical protein
VQTALMNVRFEGNNGHDADVTRCRLLTHSGQVMSPDSFGNYTVWCIV